MKQLIIRVVLSLTVLAVLSACASTGKNDPLNNTKQLVNRGHKSLYENGAFHVPNTSMSLIPAGPSAIEFAKELAGVKAPQALFTSLKNARESVTVVSVGTQKTYEISEGIYDGGGSVAQGVTAINDGVGIINYTGHAGPTGWGNGAPLGVNDVNNLTNNSKYPFIFTVGFKMPQY